MGNLSWLCTAKQRRGLSLITFTDPFERNGEKSEFQVIASFQLGLAGIEGIHEPCRGIAGSFAMAGRLPRSFRASLQKALLQTGRDLDKRSSAGTS